MKDLTWNSNKKYLEMLSLFGKLSNLFADSSIPYIHYRITENLFCKYCNAENLSRTDTAYDARIGDVGIGIKTFQLISDSSIEKIAEFNALSSELSKYKGKDLAYKLAEIRNERMYVADNLYEIKKRLYHIIGRRNKSLCIFDASYPFIDASNITDVRISKAGLRFNDGKDEYTFNRSKSVLMKKFIMPENNITLPIEIIKDPYSLLEQLLNSYQAESQYKAPILGKDYVILPLYSTRTHEVPLRSGLNQWNAAGRKRDYNEAYIPVPATIHNNFPDFFPPRNVKFSIVLPNGTTLKAKICQDGGKALMTDPNKDLGDWLLRKVLRLKDGTLLTMQKLNEMGFDSVRITRLQDLNYSIETTIIRYEENS